MPKNLCQVAFTCGAAACGNYHECKNFLLTKGHPTNGGLPCRHIYKQSDTLIFCKDKEAVRDAAKDISKADLRNATSKRFK